MLVTFLEAKVPLTKTFTLENGKLQKIGHPKILDYKSHERTYNTLQELATLIEEHGARGHCMLKGNLVRQLDWEPRRGTTDPNAPTELVCLDLDGSKGTKTPQEALDAMGWGDVDHVIQYSASSGVVPDRGLSAHIFVLLDQPVAPPLLKQVLTRWNLSIAAFRAHIALSRTYNALRWPLDVSTCQNDKLIYIAPPVLGKGVVDGFEGQRVQFVERTRRRASLPSPLPSEAMNRGETLKVLNTLRTAQGLQERPKEKYKVHGLVEYFVNPDKATITGQREERGFVYFNLNGGDSWGYYHPKGNPEFIYNFKGEPVYKTSELLPEYWTEVRKEIAEPKADSKGNLYLAFRDFRTAVYYNGIYHADEDRLELYRAGSKDQLKDFLKQHGQPVPDFIADWNLEYNPTVKEVIDVERRWVNRYQRSEVEKEYDAMSPAQRAKYTEVPPLTAKVLRHVLGNDEQAYEHFINWIAVSLQFKLPPATSWVWHGVQGTGKGLFLDKILRPMFGKSNVVTKRMQELDSQFNGFLEGCQVLWIEEAEASAFRNAAVMDANFKNYIVEPWISVRHMFMAPYEVRNYLCVIFSSNKDDPIILDPHDRRFNIGAFQASKIAKREGGWMTIEEIDALGDEALAFYAYLRNYKADRERARTALNNEAKALMAGINQLSVDAACSAIKSGDLQFFVDLKSQDPAALPRFAQERAEAYAQLVDEMGKRKDLTRDELHLLLDYVVGDMPTAPAKFTKLLGHHGIPKLKVVRRGETTLRGIDTSWRT